MSRTMPKQKRKRGKKVVEESEISKNVTSDQVTISPKSNHEYDLDTAKPENSQSSKSAEDHTEEETKMQHPVVTSSSTTEEEKNIPEATDKNGRKIGKHICNICGRAFNAPSRVTRHLIVHTKEKPYKCEICEKPYSQIEILKKHWQTMHKVDFPYKCHSCEKSFIVPSILEWHVKRAHKVKEPTKCTICLKEFARPHFLTKHIELFHALDQAYLCEFCGKIFEYVGQLKLHQKKHCIILETSKADATDLESNLAKAATLPTSPQNQELLMDVSSDLIGVEDLNGLQDTNTEPNGDEATVSQWGEEKMEHEPGSTNLSWTPDSQTAADGTMSPWKDTQLVVKEEKVDPGTPNLPSLWIPESQAWCRVQSATSSDSSSSPVCSGSSTSNISAPSPGLVVSQHVAHLDTSVSGPLHSLNINTQASTSLCEPNKIITNSSHMDINTNMINVPIQNIDFNDSLIDPTIYPNNDTNFETVNSNNISIKKEPIDQTYCENNMFSDSDTAMDIINCPNFENVNVPIELLREISTTNLYDLGIKCEPLFENEQTPPPDNMSIDICNTSIKCEPLDHCENMLMDSIIKGNMPLETLNSYYTTDTVKYLSVIDNNIPNDSNFSAIMPSETDILNLMLHELKSNSSNNGLCDDNLMSENPIVNNVPFENMEVINSCPTLQPDVFLNNTQLVSMPIDLNETVNLLSNSDFTNNNMVTGVENN